MLNGNLGNKGIYGYEKSKDKKNIDLISNARSVDNGKSLDDFRPAEELAGVEDVVKRVENYNNLLGNKEERSKHYFDAARESLVPKDTEERRRRNFVLSRNVAEDAVNDFYKKSVRPVFQQQRQSAEDAAGNVYKKTAAIPGVHPFSALGEARNAADPAKVVGATMEKLDNEQLNKLADAYARYGGLDTESYRDAVLKPNIENRIYDEYVKENKPKNSLEYIARSAYDNSLTGKLTNLTLDEYSRTDTQRILDSEALQNYGANRAENFAAGVGALLIDSGVFAGLGGAASKLTGKATSAISKNLVSRVMAKGAPRGLSEQAARRIVDRTFIDKIGTRIAASGTSQGLTLGAYDATNSVADDLLYGNNVDAGKAAGSFAKGFGTGMMLGAVGAPLKQKAIGLTGGKKVAASAGVLSAESAVFTLGTEIDKYANGIEIEPIDLLGDFGESAATLLAMRMAHWRPKGYREKLNSEGRLKEGLDFNVSERQEIRKAGVNPDNFIASIEQELHPRYPSLHGNARRDFIRNYEGLMADEGLSASTRAKLLYIVENKLTSTPPVPVDCEVEFVDGTAMVNVKDNAGRNVQRLAFESRAKADAFVERNSGTMRRNRIASIEEMFQRSVDSENFFRQAGEYAKETGVSIEEISNAMYKKAKRQSLNSREVQLMDDIMNRSSYNDIELGNVMHDIRRKIEQRYGLNKGALLSAVDKNRAECTVAENNALSDYEGVIRAQAERLRSGVTEEMHGDARRLMKEQGLGEYDNEHIRDYERAYDASVKARPLRGNPNIKDYYKSLYPKEYEDALKNGFPYPADGEGPILPRDARNPTKGYMYNHDTLARMAVGARDIAKRLNADVELVYDPHQLDSSQGEYGYQTMAKGWYDMNNDKIVLNLANNKSLEDVEFTLLHEIVGHRGLYKLFGDSYIDFLKEVGERASSKVANEFKISSFETEIDRYDKIDEYLAEIAEKKYKSPAERGILNSFKNFIGDALYRMGMPIRDLNEKKIAMLLSKHRDAIVGGMGDGKHRRKVFGSFGSAHLGEDAYRIDSESTEPRYRYRFIGEKGFENIIKAREERQKKYKNSKYKQSPKFKYDYLGNHELEDEMTSDFERFDPESFRWARDYRNAKMKEEKNEYDKEIADEENVPNWRYRVIGEEGLGNLLKSNSSDAHVDNYNLAAKMFEYGYDPVYIKKKSGWEIGADGKWRYEIDDRDVTVEYYPLLRMYEEYPKLSKFMNDYINNKYDRSDPELRIKVEDFYRKLNTFMSEQPKLPDVIRDAVFYDAYPKFRNVKVEYVNYPERPCIYDKSKNTFFIDKKMLGKKELNMHAAAEMQRMIQDFEGFSKAYPMHKVLPGDVYEQAMKPVDDSDIYKISGDGYWNDPASYYEKKRMYKKKYGIHPADVPEEQSLRDDFLLSILQQAETAQSGNVETRNVMNRFDLDNKERRNSLAMDTEDVFRDYQISPRSINDVRDFLSGPIYVIKMMNKKLWDRRNKLPNNWEELN